MGDVRPRDPAQLSHHGRVWHSYLPDDQRRGQSDVCPFPLETGRRESLAGWDEAQKLTGRDPDFHRRELWESIEAGDFPEYELGLQLIPEEDEFKFDFDLLDPTKLIPEELVPVQLVGKMVLNRNPDNFFAENEQAAFHPGHIVPGPDFTNDPLLQGRLFSHTDTQISRLGGPNFHEIPINRPTCPYHNFQRDGMHRQDIDTNPANYEPNSINDNWPRETPPPETGGFESYQERGWQQNPRAQPVIWRVLRPPSPVLEQPDTD